MLNVAPAGSWPFLGFILMHSNNSVATHVILHLFVAGFSLKRVLYYIVNRHFFTTMIRYLLKKRILWKIRTWELFFIKCSNISGGFADAKILNVWKSDLKLLWRQLIKNMKISFDEFFMKMVGNLCLNVNRQIPLSTLAIQFYISMLESTAILWRVVISPSVNLP